MAVTVGATITTYSDKSTGNQATNRSFAHTVDAGSGRCLVVALAYNNTSVQVTSVTFNGAALTRLAGTTLPSTSGPDNGVALWYFVNPPEGAGTIQVTTSAVVAGTTVIAINLLGVNPSTPFGTPATNGGGTNVQPSLAVAGSVGDLILDAVFARNQPLTAGSGQTELAELRHDPAGPHALAVSTKTATGASTSMTWTVPESFNWQTQVGVAVLAADAAPPANTAPVVDVGADATLTAGDTFSRTATFTDADSTSWTATVDYGEGAGPQAVTPGVGTVALSNLYEASGTYTVTVTVDDGEGGVGSDTATVTVSAVPPANVAPVVTAGADAATTQYTLWTQAGSFTDADSASWTATVDYGEGGGAEPLTLSGTTFTLSHTYATTGVKTVTVSVTDDGGQTGSDTVQVTVSEGPTLGQYIVAEIVGTDASAPVVTLS